MPKKRLGMNKHQKAVYKVGERRTGSTEIAELLEMSRSGDAEERCVAAEHLCPCHVRTRIPAVWDALYRMLEDPEPRVRRAAWHTLLDGGRPDDPVLDAIFARAQRNETDRQARNLMRQAMGKREDEEAKFLKVAHLAHIKPRGKCDFCGAQNVPVDRDCETMIPTGDLPRAAWICEPCAAGR